MKTQTEKFTRQSKLIVPILLTALVCIVGCATPNPLAGWKHALHNPNQAIVNDYQNYIQNLPPEEKKYAGPIECFEDGIGQYAVLVYVGINGTVWQHVLIYDKDSKRIKTVKFTRGGYRS